MAKFSAKIEDFPRVYIFFALNSLYIIAQTFAFILAYKISKDVYARANNFLTLPKIKA